jgi:hypothetical protein
MDTFGLTSKSVTFLSLIFLPLVTSAKSQRCDREMLPCSSCIYSLDTRT